MESRLADEGEVSDDSSGQHNRGRAKALWAEVVQGVGRTLEHAARPTTPMEKGRVPPSERRRRSTSGREARVGRDRAVRLAAAGNADAERHTSASSRTGEKPMSGYSGAGRKRGHAATARTRPAKSIAAEACPGISPKRNLGSAEGVGARHSTEDRRDNTTRRREGCALR